MPLLLFCVHIVQELGGDVVFLSQVELILVCSCSIHMHAAILYDTIKSVLNQTPSGQSLTSAYHLGNTSSRMITEVKKG